VINDDQIKSLIESNPHYMTREIAEIIDVSQKTVVNHLHTFGYVSRYDIWVGKSKHIYTIYIRIFLSMSNYTETKSIVNS